MGEVSRGVCFKGNGRFTSEPLALFQKQWHRAILQLCLLFYYLHECFITTCTRSRSAANQHDPLSLSILLSLESIYCTSGNAAELDEVTVHPCAHSSSVRGGQHIWIPCTHTREIEDAVHQIPLCSVFVRYSYYFASVYKVMKVIEHKITDTSYQNGNDLKADSTTDTEFDNFTATTTSLGLSKCNFVFRLQVKTIIKWASSFLRATKVWLILIINN